MNQRTPSQVESTATIVHALRLMDKGTSSSRTSVPPPNHSFHVETPIFFLILFHNSLPRCAPPRNKINPESSFPAAHRLPSLPTTSTSPRSGSPRRDAK